MQEAIKVFVGLDVHKDSIAIGAAEPGRAPAAPIGRVAHDVNKLLKTLAKLGRAEEVHVVYEAGPTGYGLQRALAKRGYVCEVIAPSQIPRRAGERIKTDRRDCLRLAECSRAGELRAVWIPDLEDEAIRDLARAREDAVHSRTQARRQLKGFLLRHDVSYPGKTSWTKSFHVWLGTLNFGPASAQTAFTEYQLAVQAADQRVERLTHALAQSIHGWRFEPVVASLQALRGVDAVTAIGLVAEIGDLARFEHPRKLMGYLGLVPSEASSGERVARGSITKTGNGHARRLLVEAAWHYYRCKPRIGQRAQQRQHALGSDIKAVAWKAQLRLARRFAALDARGVQRNKACVAVARELAGFVWAIGRRSMHATNPTAIPTSTQSH
jgi:transposase